MVKLFRALLSRSDEVYGAFAPDGTTLYISPSVKRLLGYSPEELVGASRKLSRLHRTLGSCPRACCAARPPRALARREEAPAAMRMRARWLTRKMRRARAAAGGFCSPGRHGARAGVRDAQAARARRMGGHFVPPATERWQLRGRGGDRELRCAFCARAPLHPARR